MLSEEIWLPVNDYEEIYEVSDLGRIRRIETGRILKGNSVGLGGHLQVTLSKSGNEKNMFVHRLIASAFLGLEGGLQVNHLDRNPLNNNLSNLECVTQRENITHASNKKIVGAYYEKREGRWSSKIGIEGKNVYLGRFATEEEAGEAYRNALKKYGLENKYAQN